MKFGIEVLLEDKKRMQYLKKKRVSLVGHPASVDLNLTHTLDLLVGKLKMVSAFGPQHGMKGDKQYNMIETDDDLHPKYKIPIYSLYGSVRHPSAKMMEGTDVVLFDLQDVGCRIYTFGTTLLYMMQACAHHEKELWVLDRPNPAGRAIEGLTLEPGHESFVGAAPIPMRHGLTLGELALFYKDHFNLDLQLHVIKMKGYAPNQSPGFGWPTGRAWVNPSPNIATLNSVRVYPGSVMIEGTHLSEGRGTTHPLELVGAPDVDASEILKKMIKLEPKWVKGCKVRECFFEPTFYKYSQRLCSGLQLHTDFHGFVPENFKPFRFFCLYLKALKLLQPDYELFREFKYEYVEDRLAFDVIAGTQFLRHWLESPSRGPKELEKRLKVDETLWRKKRKKYLLYS